MGQATQFRPELATSGNLRTLPLQVYPCVCALICLCHGMVRLRVYSCTWYCNMATRFVA